MPPTIPRELIGRGAPTHSVSQAQAELLARLATDKIVLEIGAFLGGSTIVLASVAQRVYSLDTHMLGAITTPKPLPPILGGGRGDPDTLPRFRANLKRYGLRDRVVILCGYASDVLPYLQEAMFDLAFIDGGHEEDAVRFDAQQAIRLVRLGGAICFHDVEMASVQRVLAELPTPRILEHLAIVDR